MVELQTEVSLAVIDSYLSKNPEERTEKHRKLADEAMKILSEKQNQFSERDKVLYQRFLRECMSGA